MVPRCGRRRRQRPGQLTIEKTGTIVREERLIIREVVICMVGWKVSVDNLKKNNDLHSKSKKYGCVGAAPMAEWLRTLIF